MTKCFLKIIEKNKLFFRVLQIIFTILQIPGLKKISGIFHQASDLPLLSGTTTTITTTRAVTIFYLLQAQYWPDFQSRFLGSTTTTTTESTSTTTTTTTT